MLSTSFEATYVCGFAMGDLKLIKFLHSTANNSSPHVSYYQPNVAPSTAPSTFTIGSTTTLVPFSAALCLVRV